MGSETPSAIATLFGSITTVITNILSLFGTVASTLMSNPLFQITLGIIILSIAISLVMYFVRKIKTRG